MAGRPLSRHLGYQPQIARSFGPPTAPLFAQHGHPRHPLRQLECQSRDSKARSVEALEVFGLARAFAGDSERS
jgi:hypothetical protein